MTRTRKKAIRWLGVFSFISLAACGHMSMGSDAKRPAASEFGFGPRESAAGLYNATLDPVQEIRMRRIQTMRVRINDAHGQPVQDAVITVDGGMPQHGHGLPTQPRITGYLTDGVYQVEGVKFNMGGWWELRFAIASGSATDTVTFNLDL